MTRNGGEESAAEAARLRRITRRLRERVIRMVTAAGSGHPGGSLSAASGFVSDFRLSVRRPG